MTSSSSSIFSYHTPHNAYVDGLNSLASAILPSYAPYDVIYDVIANPHYSASYPYAIVDLGLELGLQLRLGL